LTADPTNRFLYVTDFASNQMIGYGIYTGYTINFLLNGPYKTGGQPSAISIDPRGKFMYVSNSLDSSVTAYVIDLPTGTPSTAVSATGTQTNATDTQPVAVAVEPALGRYVYTANFLGNSVSGFRLDPTAGTLKQTQATPYPVGIHPTAVVIAPHGNHSTQTVTP
jgi:6-phosphogluconolactonase (cycloisomerase 2 family)